MKRITILAVVLVLLLCGCSRSPEQKTEVPTTDEAETAPVETVQVTTLTGIIDSIENDEICITPDAGSEELLYTDQLSFTSADGLIPCGSDGWPISFTELSVGMRIDVTYLGTPETVQDAVPVAVSIRLVPDVSEEAPVLTEAAPAPVPASAHCIETPVEITACLYDGAIEAPVDAEIPYVGNTHFGFPTVRTQIVCTAQYDLDLCGSDESVLLLCIWDEYDQSSYVLRIAKEDSTFDTGLVLDAQGNCPVFCNPHVWLSDLDGNGQPEVLFCGDLASDDYYVSAWSFSGSGLQPILIDEAAGFPARITSVEEHTLHLMQRMDVLGSHNASNVFELIDGAFSSMSDTWQIATSDDDGAWLEVRSELPVTTVEDEVTVLPVGTRLQITGTDGESFAEFLTEDALTGRIALERSEDDSGWLIAGISENEYFTVLPYAG